MKKITDKQFEKLLNCQLNLASLCNLMFLKNSEHAETFRDELNEYTKALKEIGYEKSKDSSN